MSGRNYQAPSVVRAFKIIESLSEAPSGRRITELSQLLDVPISSTSIILNTLHALGYLVKDRSTFRLSTRLLEIGNRVLESKQLSWALKEPLRELVEDVQITAHAAVLEGHHAVIVEKVSPSTPSFISINTYVGRRAKLNCTSLGKLLVAFQEPELRKDLLKEIDFKPLTSNTIADPKAYEQELERVRANGYAVDDEEEELGIRCIGAPVMGKDGKIMGAISLCGTTAQLRVSNWTSLIRRVQATAQKISSEFGYVSEETESTVEAE